MTYGYGQMHTRPGEPMEPTGMVGKGVGEQEERNKIKFLLHNYTPTPMTPTWV